MFLGLRVIRFGGTDWTTRRIRIFLWQQISGPPSYPFVSSHTVSSCLYRTSVSPVIFLLGSYNFSPQISVIFIPYRITDLRVAPCVHKTLLVIFTTLMVASDNCRFLAHYCLNISMHGVTAYGWVTAARLGGKWHCERPTDSEGADLSSAWMPEIGRLRGDDARVPAEQSPSEEEDDFLHLWSGGSFPPLTAVLSCHQHSPSCSLTFPQPAKCKMRVQITM